MLEQDSPLFHTVKAVSRLSAQYAIVDRGKGGRTVLGSGIVDQIALVAGLKVHNDIVGFHLKIAATMSIQWGPLLYSYWADAIVWQRQS